MLRSAIVRSARPLAQRRLLSSTSRVMGAGDTGSPLNRAGGERSGDAFSKREHAAEEMYIRKEELEKLRALKAKIQSQRQHMDELEKHIDDLTKSAGGQGEVPGH